MSGKTRMPLTGQEHHFSITSTFAEVADVAERAGDLCATAGAVALSDSLRLCLAEALNNVVEHAYRGEANGKIDIDLTVSPESFAVTVTDAGEPMPGGTLPAGDIDMSYDDIDELPEGGFGWMLIRSEVDRLDYERRGDRNVLSLGKRADA